MPYKQLSIEQMAFILNNGSSMTVIELKRAMGNKVSETKIRSELRKINIVPPVKHRHIYMLDPKKKKSITGLLPQPQRTWTRPPAVYSNQNKFLYKEIADMQ